MPVFMPTPHAVDTGAGTEGLHVNMASEMYQLISNQVKADDFTSSFNVQSGALNQARVDPS
jgi:hypothetical protein